MEGFMNAVACNGHVVECGKAAVLFMGVPFFVTFYFLHTHFCFCSFFNFLFSWPDLIVYG